MKKLRQVVAILLCTIVFAGIFSACGQNSSDANVTNDIGDIFDKEIKDDGNKRFYEQQYMLFETESGIYFLDDDGFINFYDFVAQRTVLVCNKPNCKHQRWNSSTPDEQRCNAYQENEIRAGFAYGGKLYLNVVDPFAETAVIIRSDLDCSNQIEIAKLDTSYSPTMYVHDGILYITSHQIVYSTNEEGIPEATGKGYNWLYDVDLESGEVTELTERKLGYNSELRMICASDDIICLYYSYFKEYYDGTNFKEADPQSEFYEYNITTGEYKQIEINSEALIPTVLAFNDDNVFLTERDEVDTTSKLVKIDQITGERTVICEEISSAIVDWSYDYIIYISNDGECIYDISSGNTKKLEAISGFHRFNLLDHYIFGTGNDSICSGSDGKRKIISKVSYYDGAAENIIRIDRE